MNTDRNFHMKMPKDIWVYLKKTAAEQGIPMRDLMINLLNKYIKRKDKNNVDSINY